MHAEIGRILPGDESCGDIVSETVVHSEIAQTISSLARRIEVWDDLLLVDRNGVPLFLEGLFDDLRLGIDTKSIALSVTFQSCLCPEERRLSELEQRHKLSEVSVLAGIDESVISNDGCQQLG